MHNFPHIIHFVIEKLISLNNPVPKLSERLFKSLNILLIDVAYLPYQLFIKCPHSVIDVLITDPRSQELLAILDAPESLPLNVIDILPKCCNRCVQFGPMLVQVLLKKSKPLIYILHSPFLQRLRLFSKLISSEALKELFLDVVKSACALSPEFVEVYNIEANYFHLFHHLVSLPL
jgi:hypothetical protein